MLCYPKGQDSGEWRVFAPHQSNVAEVQHIVSWWNVFRNAKSILGWTLERRKDGKLVKRNHPTRERACCGWSRLDPEVSASCFAVVFVTKCNCSRRQMRGSQLSCKCQIEDLSQLIEQQWTGEYPEQDSRMELCVRTPRKMRQVDMTKPGFCSLRLLCGVMCHG